MFLTKSGKELDMKGRCSMGQRVLASIIIRLALANAFCTKCDILALDEPTTNLDRKHITILSEQLKILIEERIEKENFQLIIISHDKEFIKSLGEYTNEYFKVYKDKDSFSLINRININSLE